MKILKFTRLWFEIWASPVLALVFLLMIQAIHYVDPMAASLDGGALQLILLGHFLIMSSSGLAWLMLKVNFPNAHRAFAGELYKPSNTENFSANQKCDNSFFSLGFLAYWLYLLGGVTASLTILWIATR